MIPKRLHYGWIMVIISTFVTGVYSMTIYTFGIFLIPVTAEFGWDRGALSLSLSLATIIGGVLAIPAGRINDRVGPRILATIGGLAAGTGYLLMTQISYLWQVYLLWGLLMGVARACSLTPIISTIPRWFKKKRGIAMGITTSGVALGGMISPPAAQWLISSQGWRFSYVVLGLLTLVVFVLAAQFMRHSPQRMGLKPYGENASVDTSSAFIDEGGFSIGRVTKTGYFWIFTFITLGFIFSMQTIVIHIAPHAIDIGISDIAAASLPSIIAGVSLIGRLGVGSVSDRVGPRRALVVCLIVSLLAFIWLLFSGELWALYIFAAILGFGYGGETSVMMLVPAELFGLKHIGVITATTGLFNAIGGAIGAPLAGAIFDATGSYRLAFLICVAVVTLAFVCSLFLLRSKSYKDIGTP